MAPPDTLACCVYDAEAVALGVGKDHIVRVEWSPVPVDLGGSERDQPLDLASLVVRIQVEVDARREVDL